MLQRRMNGWMSKKLLRGIDCVLYIRPTQPSRHIGQQFFSTFAEWSHRDALHDTIAVDDV
jgi:hypothetical protein